MSAPKCPCGAVLVELEPDSVLCLARRRTPRVNRETRWDLGDAAAYPRETGQEATAQKSIFSSSPLMSRTSLFGPPLGDGARSEAEIIDRSFPRTDAGNGELFASLYGDRVRFDHRRKRWLMWRGHWWAEDGSGEIRTLAKQAARHRYLLATMILDLRTRTEEARFAIASESRQRLDAMLVQAQSEPPLSSAGDHWDSDALLFAVSNGVLDLRNGSFRCGLPDEITLHTDVAFDAEADCPRWLRFLDEVFQGDHDLIGFIWRSVGYSLTGETREQCVFTCYGTGSNGKTVFLNVLQLLAGRYAYSIPFQGLEFHSRGSIPNDIAALVGARLVTASETDDGVRLNEARLKSLTGGDPITAGSSPCDARASRCVGDSRASGNARAVLHPRGRSSSST